MIPPKLLLIMSIPPHMAFDLTVTSDGHYLAMDPGDIGFNRFLGRPNPNPMPSTSARAWGHWHSLSGYKAKKRIVWAARARGINLRTFLPKA